MVGKKIFRAIITTSEGKRVGFKLVEGTSLADVSKRKRSFVGPGRKISGFLPTKLKGAIRSRAKLPRTRRFGKGFR